MQAIKKINFAVGGVFLAALLAGSGIAAAQDTQKASNNQTQTNQASQTGPTANAIMEKNIKVVQELYAGFANGDMPSVMAVLAPDVRWVEAEGGPYAGTFIGPDAVLENLFMRLANEWHSFTAVPKEFTANENTVVSLGEYSGTHKATGKSFTAPFAHVWRLQDGKIVSYRQFTDTVLHQGAVE